MAEVAGIYRALAMPDVEVLGPGTIVTKRRAFSPVEVDDMELWLIAEFLNVNDEPDVEGAMTPEEFEAMAHRQALARATAGARAATTDDGTPSIHSDAVAD